MTDNLICIILVTIGMVILILGGAKSGKSKFALEYAENLSFIKNFYYLATAQALDEEMKEKIEKHQRERKEFWKLIEEPIEIKEKLELLNESGNLILIDCLTLWITNLMEKNLEIEIKFREFLEILESFSKKEDRGVICVGNEVGLGLVPENFLGRKFRDYAGLLNQRVANLAKEVYFLVAGCPIKIKHEA
ncbi:MAG: bifunctional adenosylcobinamide kinase/adenosylcobinamide-phosphate guanylyltransferase [Thermodesulfobacterium sp.]|nr:bifunctional adenosylcobinamide kinase/adenosylcobinamide-phosphate guanylyltransferase [Thermodesulfobacterium sp.]